MNAQPVHDLPGDGADGARATYARIVCADCTMSFVRGNPKMFAAERLVCPDCQQSFWSEGGWDGRRQFARCGIFPDRPIRLKLVAHPAAVSPGGTGDDAADSSLAAGERG